MKGRPPYPPNLERVPAGPYSPANNTFRAPAIAGSGAAYLALLQRPAGPSPRSSLRTQTSELKPDGEDWPCKPLLPTTKNSQWPGSDELSSNECPVKWPGSAEEQQ
jgi:hypothetical protein